MKIVVIIQIIFIIPLFWYAYFGDQNIENYFKLQNKEKLLQKHSIGLIGNVSHNTIDEKNSKS